MLERAILSKLLIVKRFFIFVYQHEEIDHRLRSLEKGFLFFKIYNLLMIILITAIFISLIIVNFDSLNKVVAFLVLYLTLLFNPSIL